MCCFSGPVHNVTNTNIFARLMDDGRQALVYSMRYQADAALAMVLPLPTPPASADDAVTFVDLSAYATFFDDVLSGFPVPTPGPAVHTRKGPVPEAAPAPLPVIEVGDFVASFVPRREDFTRLDARFRLSDALWQSLPLYHDYGFAVFQLKPGMRSVQPMAFRFPTRDRTRLFFPTVHIHDGSVPMQTEFHHTLYCQRALSAPLRLVEWEESPQLANRFVAIPRTQGIVADDQHVYKLGLSGVRSNQDIWTEPG